MAIIKIFTMQNIILKFVNTRINLVFLLSKNRFMNRIILFNNQNIILKFVNTKINLVFTKFNIIFAY